MTDQQPPPTRNAVRRFIPAVLLASLSLNLFLAGWLAGSGFRPPLLPPMGGPFRSLERRLEGRLSPDGMAKIGALLGAMDAGMRRQFDARDAMRRKLHAILITEPFDREGFVAALTELNAGRAQFDGEVSRRVAEVVATLSVHDRAIFADEVLALPPGPLG